MKNLITYLKALWGAWGNLQSSGVRHDCRRSDLRRSPSGLDAKWKQNPFMRFAVVLTLIFTIGSGNVWGATETLTMSEMGWDNASTQSSIPASSATIALAKNSGSTAPTYYTSDGLRIYGVKSATTGGTIAFTAVDEITQIQFTHTANNSGVLSIKSGGGSYSSKTWTGTLTAGNTLTLVATNSGTKAPQVRITVIAITYKAKVTFNANGGSCATANATQSTPTSTVTLPTPTRAGFTCTGWYTASSGGTKRGNAGATYTPSASETLYAQWESSAPACSNAVALSKGSATNGTVNTISSANVATCSATASDRRVTITITPDDCYDAPTNLTWTKSSGTVTASKYSGPTGNGNGTYSYVYQFAQNDNGAGTFGVTCTAKAAGKTVNFDAGPGSCGTSSLTETCDGSGVTLPAVTATGVCKGWTTFAGWRTSAIATADSTTTNPGTLYAAGSTYYPSSDNETLYAVFSKTKGGGTTPTKETLTFGTSYASNASDLTSVTIYTGITATATEGTTNNPKFYTSSPGTWRMYSGSELTISSSIGNITKIEFTKSSDFSLSVKSGESGTLSSETWTYASGVSSITFNVGGTTKLSAIAVTYLAPSSTTYYCSDPNCCTPLGTINGSINMTSSTDGTVTISDWTYAAGSTGTTESNVSSYTVKLYKLTGTSPDAWTIVSGSTSGGSSGTQGTRTGIATNSKSVTYSGLEYGATYKFTVTAIGTGSYCDGSETAVTSINGNSLTDNKFLNKYYIHIDDGTQSDSGWEDYYFTSLTSHAGSVDVTLNAFTDYYQYKLSLGGVIWWGNNSKMTSSDHTNWTLYTAHGNVKLQTAMGGTYTFGLNAATPAVTVTYPTSNQASGYHIYFDNSILEWSTLRYRIGNNSHNQNSTLALVTGTDNFYVATTPSYDGMEAWHIANNTGWADSHTIYRTATNNESGQPEIAITASIVFQQYKVTEDITVIPTTSHTMGTDNTGDKVNNQCEFYTINTPTSGMLTHNISVGSADHGTVVATYTNTSGTANQTVAEGANADLAHRCIVTITATPDAGYTCSSLTVNGAAFTSGSTHILTADATVAATFTAKTYNITLDREGADNGSTSVTMTYNSATHTAITAPTKSGYDFGGWWTGDNGTGTMVMNASGVLQANVSDYTGAGGIWTKDATCTLYAKWTPVNYTISYDLDGGSEATPNPTSYTILSSAITLNNPTKTGYDFAGWTGTGLAEATMSVTIAAGSSGERSYTATWSIKKYTVTWHVGDVTSTTSNVSHGTTFSTLEASAPAHADNALAACGSTKFIGWVKASGAYTDDGKTVDWYNTHKANASDAITDNTDYYAMYAEAEGAEIYSRVTSDLGATNWAGDYLIAYSSTKFADGRTGGTSGMGANGAAVNPDTKLGTLVDTVNLAWGNTYNVTLELIDNSTNTYVLKTKDGNYNYQSSNSNGLLSTATKATAANYPISVTFTSSSDIKLALGGGAAGAVFRYNTSSSGYFRYYKDGGQSAVYLYKKTQNLTNYRTGCTVSCSRPTPSAPASVTKTSATISWTDPATSGTLDHYEYKVWEDGDDEPVSGTTNGTNLSKALTGLYSGVTYHWKVRRVCDGEDASIWVAGSDFTTTDATLTFSVPTGATAVDPSTTATNLPEADAPTDCGDCWVFVGWTTAAYAESSSAPATLFPAGIKARVSGDATLYAVYGKDEGKYRIIDDLASITSGENYVLTKGYIPTTDAVGNANSGSYYRQIPPVAITVKTDIIGEYIDNPATTVIWKLIGDASKGRLFNETASLYIDLHASTGSIDYLVSSTSDYINITLYDAETKTFNIGSNTTSTNYLFYWTDEEDDNVHWWGVDDDHDGFSSCCIFKHVYASYATSPSCPKYTVTWDVNNGASTSTTEVTKCAGYLASLPTAPANTTLSSCQTNGKFMGWSPTKVMPAQDVVPTGMFSEVEYSPEITQDTTFYAVFAEEHSGATGATDRTYTFTSASWGDDESAWSSGAAGNWNSSAVQVTKNKTGANATTISSYNAVTKVAVTYFTNASSGAGSIDIKVNGTSYTGSASVTNSGGTTPRTINFTPPSSALDGAVKITVTCTDNSIYIKSVQIFYTGSTTTYDQYRTACCNDPQLKFLDGEGDPTAEYVIVREDLASASSVVEIDCDISSLNTTEDITWKQTKRIKTDYHTANTWNASQTDRCQIDITNHKISAYETGSWQITIEQLMGSTNYCDGTATVNILVKTIDKFIDAVNGNFSGEAQSLEDTGNGILLPTEAMFSTNNGCADGTTRRLIGWIKASDLATYASSRRVDMIDDLKTSDPATNTVIAPGTKVQATGVTWYAVWGVEK